MEDDDDFLMISALQHLAFCERQFALIHIEQVWAENRWTAEGKVLHERVDVVRHESRRSFRQEFGLSVRSLHYGLVGRCDLVELSIDKEGRVVEAIPVEFKRGRKKEDDEDRVQLTAQALCLEEMFNTVVPYGEFFYLQEHRRSGLEIDAALRSRTAGLVERARLLRAEGRTPAAVYSKRQCDNCSLLELCMPKKVGAGAKAVGRYMASQIAASRVTRERQRDEGAEGEVSS